MTAPMLPACDPGMIAFAGPPTIQPKRIRFGNPSSIFSMKIVPIIGFEHRPYERSAAA